MQKNKNKPQPLASKINLTYTKSAITLNPPVFYCIGPLCAAKTAWPVEAWTPQGLWRGAMVYGSKSCKLQGRSSMDLTCLFSISHRCPTGLKSGEFGDQFNTLTLSCSSNQILLHSNLFAAMWPHIQQTLYHSQHFFKQLSLQQYFCGIRSDEEVLSPHDQQYALGAHDPIPNSPLVLPWITSGRH